MSYEKNLQTLKDFERYLEIEEGLTANTIKVRVGDARRFTYAFKDKEYKDITISDIRAYLAYHKEKQIWTTKNTFIIKIESMRKLFKFLEHEGIIEENPIKRLAVPRIKGERVIHAFNVQEFNQLLKTIHTPMFTTTERAIFHLLASTGMRVGELINLKKGQYINFKERKIFIPETKTARPKYVKFSKSAQYFLTQHMIKDKISNSEYVFHQKNSPKPLSHYHIWLIINRLIKLSFPQRRWDKPRGPHLLRHTFAMDWIRHDGHLKGLQWIMGWSSLQMTEVYQKQSEELIDRFYSKYEQNKRKTRVYDDYGRRIKKKKDAVLQDQDV